MDKPIIFVRSATSGDVCYADEIIAETESSAIARGSGIARRSREAISQKINSGKAVIAVTSRGEWVGFSYFETWESGKFVSNSGLIVAPKFRGSGVAKSIKQRIFRMSRKLFPLAKIFSITSGSAIMRLNAALGFIPVGFEQLTQDDSFWEGCKSCINYPILAQKNRRNCLCTAMLYVPDQQPVQLPVINHPRLHLQNCYHEE